MDSERLPPGAIFGMTFGCCAWSVLLTVFFFGYGAAESALEIGLPCIVMSVGFVATVFVALEGASRLFGFRSREWKETLFGLLGYFIGLMLLLVNSWIGPAMERANMVQHGYDPVLGVTYIAPWVAWVCLALGTGLLLRVAVAVNRATSSSAES